MPFRRPQLVAISAIRHRSTIHDRIEDPEQSGMVGGSGDRRPSTISARHAPTASTHAKRRSRQHAVHGQQGPGQPGRPDQKDDIAVLKQHRPAKRIRHRRESGRRHAQRLTCGVSAAMPAPRRTWLSPRYCPVCGSRIRARRYAPRPPASTCSTTYSTKRARTSTAGRTRVSRIEDSRRGVGHDRHAVAVLRDSTAARRLRPSIGRPRLPADSRNGPRPDRRTPGPPASDAPKHHTSGMEIARTTTRFSQRVRIRVVLYGIATSPPAIAGSGGEVRVPGRTRSCGRSRATGESTRPHRTSHRLSIPRYRPRTAHPADSPHSRRRLRSIVADRRVPADAHLGIGVHFDDPDELS